MVSSRLRLLLEAWLPILPFTLTGLVDSISEFSVFGLVVAFLVSVLLLHQLVFVCFLLFLYCPSTPGYGLPAYPFLWDWLCFVVDMPFASVLYLWDVVFDAISSFWFWSRIMLVVALLSVSSLCHSIYRGVNARMLLGLGLPKP